ncbi:MAG TPA: TetR/AcrR family transcriptional regulator [Candidatus Nanopelagicales bacterium]|nr:TetR/AcrR family transcriptional regulator [Candidatus Nanopelagicales bacterium]
MSRPPGRRNADFDASREQILDRIVHTVVNRPDRSSFAELAQMSGLSRTTLRHYFGNREALLCALLEHMATLGDRAEAAYPDAPEQPLLASLRQGLEQLVFAWRVGVGALFAAGLIWGLGNEKLGPAYVRSLLEPLLMRFERRLLARLRARGMSERQARHAALALVSPVVLALLHQDALHGAECRPLDIDAFIDEHLDRFSRAWCPEVLVDPEQG